MKKITIETENNNNLFSKRRIIFSEFNLKINSSEKNSVINSVFNPSYKIFYHAKQYRIKFF